MKMLLECLWRWRVQPSSTVNLRTADAVLGQAFGLRGILDPGESNRALAAVALELHRSHGLPLILQWEIADAMPMNTLVVAKVEGHRVSGQYLDTREVLLQAHSACRRNGWNRVVIVAHPHHMWRVVRMVEKLGLTPIIPDVRSVPYDSKSMQWWTRTVYFWVPREIATRLYCFMRGWI